MSTSHPASGRLRIHLCSVAQVGRLKTRLEPKQGRGAGRPATRTSERQNMANSWRAEYSEMGSGYGGSRIMDCAGNITAAEKGKASMYVRGRTCGWWTLCRCTWADAGQEHQRARPHPVTPHMPPQHHNRPHARQKAITGRLSLGRQAVRCPICCCWSLLYGKPCTEFGPCVVDTFVCKEFALWEAYC